MEDNSLDTIRKLLARFSKFAKSANSFLEQKPEIERRNARRQRIPSYRQYLENPRRAPRARQILAREKPESEFVQEFYEKFRLFASLLKSALSSLQGVLRPDQLGELVACRRVTITTGHTSL
jgi:hypothetical protein